MTNKEVKPKRKRHYVINFHKEDRAKLVKASSAEEAAIIYGMSGKRNQLIEVTDSRNGEYYFDFNYALIRKALSLNGEDTLQSVKEFLKGTK